MKSNDDNHGKGEQDAQKGERKRPYPGLYEINPISSEETERRRRANEEYEKGYNYAKGQKDAHGGTSREPWPGLLEIHPFNAEETRHRREANEAYRAGRENALDHPTAPSSSSSVSDASSENDSQTYNYTRPAGSSTNKLATFFLYFLFLFVVGVLCLLLPPSHATPIFAAFAGAFGSIAFLLKALLPDLKFGRIIALEMDPKIRTSS